MANKFGQNPIILDTVWLKTTIPAALAAMQPIHARRIEWFKPTDTSHTLSLEDTNGNVIIQAQCETVNVSQVLWSDAIGTLILKPATLVLKTMGSGILIIYK